MEDMTPIGIVRELDNMGRVVIPIEYRKTLGLRIKDPVEILAYKEGIFIKPIKKVYRPTKPEETLR